MGFKQKEDPVIIWSRWCRFGIAAGDERKKTKRVLHIFPQRSCSSLSLSVSLSLSASICSALHLGQSEIGDLFAITCPIKEISTTRSGGLCAAAAETRDRKKRTTHSMLCIGESLCDILFYLLYALISGVRRSRIFFFMFQFFLLLGKFL